VQNAIFSIGEAIKHNEMEHVDRSLKLAERNIKRCDRIINELMDFTRIRKIVLETVDIDSWLSGVLKEYEFPEDVECIKELNTGITIPIDRELLRRAVINVVTNAVQALQDENSGGNQLKVRSEANGERLELSFIDTGPGIPEEIMGKIFEPLFSTRSIGIGLGMPIIKNMMEEHHGGLEIKSRVGQGTNVTLWLPIPKLEEK
jgi:signal transduction histidine kinase